MKTKIIFLLSLCFTLLSMKHEYHVSISQMDYNTESKTIQVSMKLHIEDVELLLKQNLKHAVRLEQDLESAEVKDFLQQYIRTSLIIRFKDEKLSYEFIGNELEEDDLWIYMESKPLSEMPDLEVKNTLFLEVFQDQTNMVHYSKDNQVVQSTVFNKQKREHTFTLR